VTRVAIIGPLASFAAAVASAPLAAQDDSTVVRKVMVSPGGWTRTDGVIRGVTPIAPETWTTDADFPSDVRVDERLKVYVGVDLQISEQGEVLSCNPRGFGVGSEVPRHGYLHASLDTTCEIFETRAKYAPAIDTEGASVAIKITPRIVFESIPDGSPDFAVVPPPAPPPRGGPNRSRQVEPKSILRIVSKDQMVTNFEPVAALDIGKDGLVSRCYISESTGSNLSDAAVCKYLMSREFKPALGWNGKPVIRYSFRAKVRIERE
jgi:hypothetical protein